MWEVLGLFNNLLLADDKYSLLSRGNLLQDCQMQLSKKPKIFSNFSLHIRNLDSILNILEKKMTLIAKVFLNLRTPKSVLR